VIGYYKWGGGGWIWTPWTSTTEEYKPTQDISAITIGVDGFASDFSTNIKVDGALAGSISGGGSVIFEVDPHAKHTFEVETLVKGVEGERFRCSGNSWTATDLIKTETRQSYGYGGYTSVYWYKGKPYYYYYYVPYSYSSTVEIPVHKSYTFTFKSEYFLSVTSEMGTPSGGEVWFTKDSKARISIEQSIPMEGFYGFLGGRYVFVRWVGDVSSSESVYSVTMDGPKNVRAQWRADYSGPYSFYTAIGGLVAVVIVACLALVLYRRGWPTLRGKGKLDQIEERLTNLEEAILKKAKKSEDERLRRLEEAILKISKEHD
jgi:hypothetical protein